VGPVLIGLLVLFAGTGLTGAVAVRVWSLRGSPTDEPLTRTVVAKDGRSQIQVPADWEDQPMPLLEDGELKVAPWPDDLCVKVLTEPKRILGQTMAHSEYARLVTDNMKRKMQGFPQVSGPHPMTVNGRPALRYELTGRVEDVSALFLLTVVEGGDHFHQVLAVSTIRAAERGRPLLERITATFREVR
jgi:hypothetical protein